MMMSIKTIISPKLQPLFQRAIQNHAIRPMTILSKTSAEEYEKKNYTSRMNRTGRPVSPNVTIYSFPITALSSIATRVTGVLLSFGSFGVGGLDLVGGSGTALSMMEYIGDSGLLFSTPAKLAVAFPIVYHSLGGMRHFIWDFFPQKYLNNEDVPKSSMVLIGSASFISLGLMLS